VRTIKASEFKAKCLQILDEVKATGEPVLVTKRGETIARLIPEEPAGADKVLMRLKKVFPNAGTGSQATDFDPKENTREEWQLWEQRMDDMLSPAKMD
jgi:prevent-host-death family protein